ncbi:hypothetical protein [Paenibacillus sp. FSL R7-0179]|uniref:hypothetical protein n=1 Tax=Paenibacillus sp. FSL R7-0179 TaxID=2921672 RepID=UPI0030FA0BFC
MDLESVLKTGIEAYDENSHKFKQFLNAVRDFFQLEPPFNNAATSVIHSVKYRLKDPDHLADKIKRKWEKGELVTKDNIFEKITDLAGIRILHLYQDQFPTIHKKYWRKLVLKTGILQKLPRRILGILNQ